MPKAVCDSCHASRSLKGYQVARNPRCRCGAPLRVCSWQEARSAVLQSLGFSNYPAYLRSDLWAEIRQRVLERDSFLCRTCGELASQIHHGNYSRDAMSGQNIADLWSLCGTCHKSVDVRHDGRPKHRITSKYSLQKRLRGKPK